MLLGRNGGEHPAQQGWQLVGKVYLCQFTPATGSNSLENMNKNCPVICCFTTNHPTMEWQKTATPAPFLTTLWGDWAQLDGTSAQHDGGEGRGHLSFYRAGASKMARSQAGRRCCLLVWSSAKAVDQSAHMWRLHVAWAAHGMEAGLQE